MWHSPFGDVVMVLVPTTTHTNEISMDSHGFFLRDILFYLGVMEVVPQILLTTNAERHMQSMLGTQSRVEANLSPTLVFPMLQSPHLRY